MNKNLLIVGNGQFAAMAYEVAEHMGCFEKIDFLYDGMQEAVGGYIDIVGLDDNVCILLNDEEKLIGLEDNRRIGSDIIVGDFFVCGSDEDGNLTSLSEEELNTYTKFFYEPQEFTKEEIEKTAVIEFYTLE